MTWQEKIIKGMQLVQEGCEEADNCEDCPFEKMCDASCYVSGIPTNWTV